MTEGQLNSALNACNLFPMYAMGYDTFGDLVPVKRYVYWTSDANALYDAYESLRVKDEHAFGCLCSALERLVPEGVPVWHASAFHRAYALWQVTCERGVS